MKKVLVMGANGMVGSAIRRYVQSHPDGNDYTFVTRKHADLTKEEEVKALYAAVQPDYVINTSAKVGGIGGNMAGHADYFRENILINTHVLHYAFLNNVEKMLAFSSVCVFPDALKLLEEEKVHDGKPYFGNFAYAYSKRLIDVYIQALKSQHGVTNYCSIIPGNIFGPNDYYNLECGHVIPSLTHKMYLAKANDKPLEVWGDGTALREFIYSDDLAEALIRMLQLDDIPDKIIISGQQEHSIKEIVDFLVEAADFKNVVIYDESKPGGQNDRKSNKERANKLIPGYQKTDIREGIIKSYKWFQDNYPDRVRL